MTAVLLSLGLLALQDDPAEDLVRLLASDEAEVRERAMHDLAALGRKALPRLEEAAQSPDAEVAIRARQAIARITRVLFDAPDLLSGRGRLKDPSVLQAGGGPETEAAVLAALKWLSRHQNDDGSWGGVGHRERCGSVAKYGRAKCPRLESAVADYDAGLTALAVLAFTGAGHSHLSAETHDGISFGDAVRKGLQWLMSHQHPDGLVGDRNGDKYMYSHALGALALAEGYGLSKSGLVVDAARKAADFTVAAQNPGKGWRYTVRCGDNDSSVTFWAFWSLYVARRVGLKVPDGALKGALAWIDEVTESGYHRVGYTHRGTGKVFQMGLNQSFDHHEALTAMGATLRMAMGAPRSEDPRVSAGVDLLLRDKPRWDGNAIDFYYWHAGTLAMFQHDAPDGPKWASWNRDVKRALLEHQRPEGSGCEAGSWAPVGRWSGLPGRVYSTALNATTLEVYYRYRLVSRR